MTEYSIYLIRVKNGNLYTGISNDVHRRFAEHALGESIQAVRAQLLDLASETVDVTDLLGGCLGSVAV